MLAKLKIKTGLIQAIHAPDDNDVLPALTENRLDAFRDFAFAFLKASTLRTAIPIKPPEFYQHSTLKAT